MKQHLVPHQSTQFPFQENMEISMHKNFKQICVMEHWAAYIDPLWPLVLKYIQI